MVIKFIETSIIKNKSDFAELIYNQFKYLDDYPKLNHTFHQIKKQLDNRDQHNILVYHDGDLIGYLLGDFRIIETDKRYAFYISYMYVLSEYRNYGIGKKMIEKCIMTAKNKNCGFIILTCDKNKNLDTYYEKFGFTEDRYIPRAYDDHVIMSYFLN